AAARVPDPMPIVVEPLAHERQLEGGTAPEVVIDVGGNRLRASNFADAAARLVAEAAGDFYFAQVSFSDPGDGSFNAVERRAALSAGLDDLLVFAGELDHAAAFADVMGDRLLDINILASLNGPNRGKRSEEHTSEL